MGSFFTTGLAVASQLPTYGIQTLGLCFVVLIVYVSAAFLVLNRSRRYDGIDTVWGQLILASAFTAFIVQWQRASHIPEIQKWLLLTMVSVWGIRLSSHIYKRFKRSNTEDPRYQRLRANWPQRALPLQVYIRIFLVQAVLAFIVALPASVSMLSSNPSVLWLCILGFIVWAFGFMTESIADKQLRQFATDHKNQGKVMSRGLWAYSRHPNYLGEITQWWGIYLIACSYGLFAIALPGPLLITILIVFVSGIPPAEQNTSSRLGWQDYKKRTKSLIPFVY